jgi:hypothetical protein
MLPIHDALDKSIAIPVSAKARASVLLWAKTWGVKQSDALRSIYLRGLAETARRGSLLDCANLYEAYCNFRLANWMVPLTSAWHGTKPDWKPVHVQRAILYAGLLAVQEDGLQVEPLPAVSAKNRQHASIQPSLDFSPPA